MIGQIADIEITEGYCVFRIKDTWAYLNRDQLATTLKEKADEIGSDQVIFDLSKLERSVRSAHLGVLSEMAFHLKTQKKRYALVVKGPSEQVIATVCKGVFETYDSVGDAVEAYGNS